MSNYSYSIPIDLLLDEFLKNKLVNKWKYDNTNTNNKKIYTIYSQNRTNYNY